MIEKLKKDLRKRVTRLKRDAYGRVHHQITKLVKPDNDMLVLALVMNTQNMGLERGTYVELAPTSGMLGVCKLRGNSVPVFEYRVFHKPMMEFIKVIVEVATPDRIDFLAVVDSKGTEDPSQDGKEIEVIEEFKKPFFLLAAHLYNYFPFWQNPLVRSDAIDTEEVRLGLIR